MSKEKTHVYVAEVCRRADTPAASAASDLRVQLAGSVGLVDPKKRRHGDDAQFR